MTRTMNPSGWAKRLGAVVGASAMAFALVATATPTVAQAAKKGPNLSKAPTVEHWTQDDNFGTKGVSAVASVPGINVNRQTWDEAVLGGKEVKIKIKTKGFGSGALTVWVQSYGNADGVGRTEWRKFSVKPNAMGVITVKATPAKVEHCSAMFIRVNDKDGRWTEESFDLKVVTEKCDTCTPAAW